jgi:hypothetical protein
MILPALLAMGFSVRAQPCDWRVVPGVQGQPAILNLLIGDFAVDPSDPTVTDNSRAYLDMLENGAAMAGDSGDLRKDLFDAGLSALKEGKAGDAAQLFAAAGRGLDENNDCGLRFYRLAARYLDAYQKSGPIFPHFNGGYYNYLKDSLFWGEADTAQYEQALIATMEMVQWTNAGSATYLELLGDLLTGHHDRFYRNYFAWLAYMRAAMLENTVGQKTFERKAVFALEYPRTNEDRFNRYRSTQLRNALEEDMATVRKKIEPMPVAPPLRFFPESSGSRLDAMLKKARQQEIARSQRNLKFDQEVDRKVVKRDVKFNVYALFLILVIISAVVFIWVKLKRANKTR